MNIELHKADTRCNEEIVEIEEVIITITKPLPSTFSMSLEEFYQLYQADAEALAAVLVNSLPEATRLRLIAELTKAEAKAAGFRGL